MRDPSPDLTGSTAGTASRIAPRARFSPPLAAAFALVLAGVVPPVGLAALPGGLSMLGAPRTGVVLLAALLFVPALVGFAVALQGFDAILTRLRERAGGEHRQIIARVLVAALVLVYVLGFIVALPDDPSIGRCLLIGALNLASAWLFLLSLILDPRRSGARRGTALVSDVTLLSILLAAGGGVTAPLAPTYLYVAISSGERHGARAVALATGFCVAGFAAVVATTRFWWENPLLAGGMLAALALLPLYVATLLRRLDAAKTQAEAANAAKSRFLAALGEDLRVPLRTLARAGASQAEVDRAQSDTLARIRLMARSMLLQLDDVLNYVRIDAGTFAPETRAFDLYRLANGAVAALRAAAAERGIVLALRIDPLLPFQLRGWPNQVRQVLNCLITNTICHSAKVKVRVNLDAVALGADRVVVRFTVSSGQLDEPLEAAGDAAEAGIAQHLALAVAERLTGLMGGALAVRADHVAGLSLSAELPFAIDQGSQGLPLDLAHLPMLIVTKDAEFVGELIEPLEAWRAEPRWIGAGDAALDYLAAMEPGARRPVLVLDGRGDVLQALSLGHRALSLQAAMPPYLLFIADESRIDSVIGLADDELDSILPAPFTLNALRSALHALWVEPADWFLAEPLPAIEQSFTSPPANQSAPKEPTIRSQPRPAAAPRPAAPTRRRGLGSKRRRRVLIAASNPANRKIMASILGRAGHAVHLAETLDETLREMDAREVDVLVLDLTGAPGADYEAARRCRRVRPGLKMVALTGDAPALAERWAREVGLDAVLPKPVEPKRLLALIDAAVDDEESEAADAPAARAVVTELASHPRFAGDTAAMADGGSVELLLSLRADRDAARDAVELFRGESRRLVADIARAARAGDVAAFSGAVRALADRTANLDAGRLREALQLLQEPTASVLRLHGGDYVARLRTELARLDADLAGDLKTAD